MAPLPSRLKRNCPSSKMLTPCPLVTRLPENILYHLEPSMRTLHAFHPNKLKCFPPIFSHTWAQSFIPPHVKERT